jgi:hypothetical protein
MASASAPMAATECVGWSLRIAAGCMRPSLGDRADVGGRALDVPRLEAAIAVLLAESWDDERALLGVEDVEKCGDDGCWPTLHPAHRGERAVDERHVAGLEADLTEASLDVVLCDDRLIA